MKPQTHETIKQILSYFVITYEIICSFITESMS